jgi:hypothetical protein
LPSIRKQRSACRKRSTEACNETVALLEDPSFSPSSGPSSFFIPPPFDHQSPYQTGEQLSVAVTKEE